LILTVNCNIEKLDPALTRPGRLLAYREFNRLRRDQACRLAQEKRLTLPDDQDDYSLAEIYCRRANTDSHQSRQIGFAS
jgi:hypothetical protein